MLAAPKPGSCCATKKKTSESNGTCGSAVSGDGTGGSCGSSCACTASTATSSVGPATGIVPPPRAADVKLVGRKPLCYKCHIVPSSVNLRDAISCSTCFTYLFVARIKSTLRLKCNLGKGVRILLGISGGASSSCLAKSLAIACDPFAPKRLFFNFDLIHIDETSLSLDKEDEMKLFQQRIMESYQYLLTANNNRRCINVPLEEVLNIGTEHEWRPAQPATQDTTTNGASTQTNDTNASSSSSSPSSSSASSSSRSPFTVPCFDFDSHRSTLRTLFGSLRDSSDKLDLLHFLRLRLLTHMTRIFGYHDLVLGDTSSKNAEELFTSVTKGRGAMIPLFQRLKERRWQTKILYPMKEQTMSQVVLFNHYMKVDTNFRLTWLNSCSLKRQPQTTGQVGLNKVTHDFLTMLDAKFNSTVSNIIGSVQKLVPPPESMAHGGMDEEDVAAAAAADRVTPGSHCDLCGHVIVAKESEEDLKTRHAGVGRVVVSPSTQGVLDALHTCYGCTALIRDIPDARLLPSYVRHGIAADHRLPGTTYLPPWYHLLQQESKRDHAQRVEENRRRKEREAEEAKAKAEQEEEEEENNQTQQRQQQQHGGLQKQSRQDMRASFAEFVLED